MTTQELSPAAAESTAIAAHEPPSETAQALAMIERAAADPAVDTAKMRDLLEMRRELKSEHAQLAFNAAMVALQSEIEPIPCDGEIRDKYGNLRSRFPEWPSLMAYLRPLLQRHGFAITRSHDADGDRVTEHLTVIHRDGHSRTNSFTVRTKGGPPGTSPEQGSGSAAKFAARYALRDAFDLIFDGELVPVEDEAQLGGPITAEQAAALRDRADALDFSSEREAKFLRFAGVEIPDGAAITLADYEKILSARLPELRASLDVAERKQKEDGA